MLATRLDLLFHRAGDAWVVVDPVTDASHTLNPSAYWILHHTDGVTPPETLAQHLAAMAGIPLEQARADIEAALANFLELGLLRPADA
jgi:hypothetical protein